MTSKNVSEHQPRDAGPLSSNPNPVTPGLSSESSDAGQRSIDDFMKKWEWLILSRVEADFVRDLKELTRALSESGGGGEAVAYLDIGAGGYMDVGTDLTDEQLAALPKGRHMLGIIGTYGVDGYTAPAPRMRNKQ